MAEEKKVYKRVEDYAEMQSVSIKTVYNWINSGKITKDRIKKVLGITLIRV